MFIPLEPEFRLRWLGKPDPQHPPWLHDSDWIPSGHTQLYAYARTGLHAILDALGASSGTALLPAYLPESAVWPFREHDYDIVYYPISEDLTYPENKIETLIDEVTPDVVLFVHYLGFADPAFERVATAASASGATVIEDCARGLFSRDATGKLLGSTGDAAVFCAHKTLPAPFGGIAVTRNLALPTPTEPVSEKKEVLRLVTTKGINQLNLRNTLRRLNGRAVPRPFYEDLAAVLPMPDSAWPPVAPGMLSRIGLTEASPPRIRSQRRARYNRVRTHLLDIDGIHVLTPWAHEGANPYGVAIRIPQGPETRNDVYHAIRRAGLPAERYIWGLDDDWTYIEDFPEATRLRETIIIIPTHQQVPWQSLPRFAEIITQTLEATSGDPTTGRKSSFSASVGHERILAPIFGDGYRPERAFRCTEYVLSRVTDIRGRF
ncbi:MULTISPECIES: DegT/DnrJ/EryC1/StrS family aminotransferase [Haloferax]|uniref:DegT/DnrJ/EryC1/StrS aminotransferase family protein n=2 Tax=Haloferax TaxID=2251 RepID=A0A6G1Z7C6_9EURY|nr:MULTISPECIES: DegT/DnrJ/EryC1/StrS family aminotransferase [Haloferax]KAB1185124.1 DegT/DnrJ/EryC1/StrS aminotransferase family protein [Haloferax sp. CBA1149]MRW82301.1 hypothetical protein [Haloferax marinisediminis]